MTTATFTSVVLSASSDAAYEFGTPVVLTARPKDQKGDDLDLPRSMTAYHTEPSGLVTVGNGGEVTVVSGARGTARVTASITSRGTTPFNANATSGLPGSVNTTSATFDATGSYLFHCDVHGSGSPGPPPTVAGISGTVVVH